MFNFLLERKVKDEEISILESFIKSNIDARELKRGEHPKNESRITKPVEDTKTCF